MDVKRLRPDDMDYQIIAFANALQCCSILFDCLAICVRELRQAAVVIDLVADCVTLSVAGCMGAQVYHEVQSDAALRSDEKGTMPPVPPAMERAPLTTEKGAGYGSLVQP